MSAGRYRVWLVLALWLAALFGTVGVLGPAFGQAAPGRDFDHLSTGYALTGAHTTARCESCHVAGVFKGTPRDCESCHVAGARLARGNVVKSASHLPTTQPCESCHNTRTYTGARMNHSGVPRGGCASCHNGQHAGGKPPTHLSTTASCDSCHTVSVWRPASGFDHAGVAPGSCAGCHNGTRATGMGASHVPFGLTTAGAAATCDSCHKSGFRSWLPARVHANLAVTAQCATCHAGIKPATPVHAGQVTCETCHKSTTTWSGAKVDHGTFSMATNCGGCHNGSGATGKNATHVPVGATTCFACHGTTTWKPGKFNHTQVPVTAQCASCHNGAYPPADGKSGTHTPYQLVAALASANCDTCHKSGYASWTPARLHTSVTVAAQCATCHAGNKPATPVHAGQTVCETCHKSTTTWSGAKVDHATFNAATNCTSCHNGSSATGKNATHVPVGATNCFACHGTATWKPTKFNHTQVPVTAQCATCHTGGYPPADGRGAAHTPYQLVPQLAAANCDTCHRAGYSAWTPARVHANTSVTAQCATCHASAKPATPVHTGQTVCETCHKSTTTWSGAKVDHATFNAATNCTSCHNGSSATGKNATHVPVGATNCFACHNTIAWKPTKFNHTQVPVTAQCASCHNGGYPPADGKPANHLPYQLVATLAAANCDSCHKAGYSSWAGGKVHANVSVTTGCKTCHNGSHAGQGAAGKPANHIPESQLLNGAAMECNACHASTTSWSARMNHNNSQGGGSGWCKGCHQSGTNYAGGMERKSLTHKTKTPPAIDCSESGCHRPLGNKGAPYTKWD
ncbi:MAG: hypothetical protein JNL30_14735 [Rubrivivax sp.]|nr:hypothetical protein [Rubrivivax sp.]